MTTWGGFAEARPELARFGEEQLGRGVAHLGTVRPDGSPRVHPVTPIIGEGRLFIFMEPTSPKGTDLRRDGRYALHSLVTDADGTGGEFLVRGRATPVEDDATRAIAVQAASYSPAERYILFELDVEGAASTVYEQGRPVRQRWGRP